MVNFFQRLRGGRSDMKEATDSDAISTLSSAYIALKSKLNMKSTGRSGVCIKKVDHERFNEMKEEIVRSLEASKVVFDLTYHMVEDPYNYLWIVTVSKVLEDTVAAIMSISDTVEQYSFSDRLLASVFEFNKGNLSAYLIYNYKLDTFYPFVPIGQHQRRRAHSEELKIMATVVNEIPFEKKMSNWYPIWNIPI